MAPRDGSDKEVPAQQQTSPQSQTQQQQQQQLPNNPNIPSIPDSTSGGALAVVIPVVVTVNPIKVVFPTSKYIQPVQLTKTIHICNATQNRVAWRVLCNAPTRYVVSPNKGFLMHQETIMVQIILISSDKYHQRHSFIVQAKTAREGENNRKKVWELKDNAIVQSIRVTTKDDVVRASKPKIDSQETTKGLSASQESITSNQSSTAASSPFSSVPSSAASSNTSVTDQQLDHGEFKDEIQRLELAVKTTIEEKNKRMSRLCEAVNDVKRLEVELDRVTLKTQQLQQRYNYIDNSIADLNSRALQAKDDLANLREQDRKHV